MKLSRLRRCKSVGRTAARILFTSLRRDWCEELFLSEKSFRAQTGAFASELKLCEVHRRGDILLAGILEYVGLGVMP